ncbi:peptidoglycan-binding protein LysM [Hypericibacter terrae]|uniref:Peptidoglycan-binding protein LysM n=1 Tax=Hypericibacter terrae TaxID=2602015 RepID=A0A5J6MLV3_9PROT|nr:LysM peptidoglycan-binding domain-containing protein [Hypericibacter terrae]QEX18201.1 peptidoglycan-binding protein LysM [Hypericibacter terrae]
MNRVLLIVILGAAVVAAALVLQFTINRQSSDEPPATVSSEQTASAPAGETATETATTETPAPVELKPSFDVVRVKPTGETVIAGRAPPGAEVTISDNGQVLGKVTADERGEWVFLPEKPLAPGNHQLSLSAVPPGGGPATESDDVVVAVVPQPGTTLAGQTGGSTGEALAVIVPRNGGSATQVVQLPSTAPSGTATPDAQAPRMGALSLDTVDYDNHGDIIVGGHAEPGAQVMIYLDNGLLGQALAGADGRWELRPQLPVPPGLHTLRADQLNGESKVTARVETPFERAKPGDLAAADSATGSIVVQPGNSLWRMARRTYGSGWQYSVIYEANKEQIRNPDLIYPGQVFKLPQASTN